MHKCKTMCLWFKAHVCVCVLPGHMVDDGGEVGGSVELNRLQTLVVGFHHAFYTRTVRVLRVPVLHWVEKRRSLLTGTVTFLTQQADEGGTNRLNADLHSGKKNTNKS